MQLKCYFKRKYKLIIFNFRIIHIIRFKFNLLYI